MSAAMRIATWNVNSLRARLEKVRWWLGRVQPDVLLMQETKLAEDDVPSEDFLRLGRAEQPRAGSRFCSAGPLRRDG